MDFSQFLSLLRARIWVFISVLLLTVATTIGISLTMQPQFKATTTLVFDSKGMDPILGAMLPVQMMPGYLATQVDVIQSHRVAVEVVKMIRAGDSPALRAKWQSDTEGKGKFEDWFASQLLDKLDVKPSRESSVMEVNFTWSDPGAAAAIADAFAIAYQRVNLELRVEPARQSAAWFDDRLKQLRTSLENAQSKLNNYQREKGFTAQDERLDLETARLAELSGQYTQAQAQAADSTSRQRQVNEFLTKGGSGETVPDVLANPLVQNLKATLSLSEGRLQQTRSQLGANHPEVKRLEADVEGQRAKLRSEISQAAASLGQAAKIAQKREEQLRSALAEQKTRLLKMSQGRDEMQVLMKEVESAQRAYDSVAQRAQQTNLESQASQSTVSVLTRAVPPVDPSFPKLFLNILLAVFLGSLLGLGVALLLETLNRRVRSGRDLVDAVGAPLLGSLGSDKAVAKAARGWKKTKSKKARPQATPVSAASVR
jgi:succinoglycan biosynthesis transport protein ExoP